MKKQKIQPVVCVCEVNGVVGVVSRKDYDKASRAFWGSLREASIRLNKHVVVFKPILLSVEPVFTFKAGSDQLKRLLRRCFVERAVFRVPSTSPYIVNVSGTLRALKYLFKSEVEERTDWKQMVEEVNALIKRLSTKPCELKLPLRLDSDPGCILNAYREGDLDFGQAVFALQRGQKIHSLNKIRSMFGMRLKRPK